MYRGRCIKLERAERPRTLPARPFSVSTLAKRIASLKPYKLNVLDCLSEGMSNFQIADKLGYKNQRTVATIVYDITKDLGLDVVYSMIEKRTLLTTAYKKYLTTTVNIPVSENQIDYLMSHRTIRVDDSIRQIESLLRRGYHLEGVEILFRRRA